MKSLGTTVRSRFQMVALLSHSRCSAPAISTGWTSDLNTLAKVPFTKPSRRCSNFLSTPTMHLLPQGPAVVAGSRRDPSPSILPVLLTDRIHAPGKPVVPRSVLPDRCQCSQGPLPLPHRDGRGASSQCPATADGSRPVGVPGNGCESTLNSVLVFW